MCRYIFNLSCPEFLFHSHLNLFHISTCKINAFFKSVLTLQCFLKGSEVFLWSAKQQWCILQLVLQPFPSTVVITLTSLALTSHPKLDLSLVKELLLCFLLNWQCCTISRKIIINQWPHFYFLVLFFFHKGKSLVPEQTDEVEAGKRGPARGSSPGKGTGECEKGHTAPLRALWHWGSWSPAHGGLTSERRQPRQRSQLWACTLMIYRECPSSVLRKDALLASLTQASFTYASDSGSDF